MGNVINTIEFEQASFGPPESVGTGKRLRVVVASVTPSASYATGGDTLLLPTGIGTLKALVVCPEIKTATDIIFWDGSLATPKLKVYVDITVAFTEATAATDQSAKTRQVIAIFLQ